MLVFDLNGYFVGQIHFQGQGQRCRDNKNCVVKRVEVQSDVSLLTYRLHQECEYTACDGLVHCLSGGSRYNGYSPTDCTRCSGTRPVMDWSTACLGEAACVSTLVIPPTVTLLTCFNNFITTDSCTGR